MKHSILSFLKQATKTNAKNGVNDLININYKDVVKASTLATKYQEFYNHCKSKNFKPEMGHISAVTELWQAVELFYPRLIAELTALGNQYVIVDNYQVSATVTTADIDKLDYDIEVQWYVTQEQLTELINSGYGYRECKFTDCGCMHLYFDDWAISIKLIKEV